jgi:hypothetical protein
MSSNENNDYQFYSNEGTAPLGDSDAIPPFEIEESTADTLEEYAADEGAPASRNNRMFMIALGVLAAVFILAIIGMIVLSTMIMPAQNARRTQTAMAILFGNEQTVEAATRTAEFLAVAAELTRIAQDATPTATEAPPEPTATETVMAPVEPTPTEEIPPVEVDLTATFEAEEAFSQTATVEALLTQVAASPTATEDVDMAEPTPNPAQLTATALAEQGDDQLPDTGFFDGGNYFVIAIAAVGLVAVIIVARKLRSA